MAQGLFNLKQQLQGLIQKAWPFVAPSTNISYSGSFNPNGTTTQYLYIASNSAFAYGTSNFTIETWIYPTNANLNSSNNYIWDSGSNVNKLGIYNGTLDWYNSATGLEIIGTRNISINAWTHVAVVRNSGTITVYQNGVSIGSGTDTTNFGNSALTIGNYGGGGYVFQGYISNFRVVKGTAVYTSNFTPPTAPLTAITNTSFLTLQNATFVDNSTNALTITNNGSMTTANLSPFSNPTYSPAFVEYLVVAGGGGGGGGSADSSGGGGAGGLLQGLLPVATGSSITVTVGGGGASITAGQNSVFGSITSTGGGKGAIPSTAGGSGGSGGGGSGNPATSSNASAGSGTVGQGNAGGTQTAWGSAYGSSGGGGAGTIGLSGNGTTAGNGGAGIASSISGTVTTYAGGGGGGIETTGAGGTGGIGGGGAGGNNTTAAGTAGTANTGGGGGGSGNTTSASGGTGGSGICIISYPDNYTAPASITGGYTASTSGSGSIYFNSSSSFRYSQSTPWQFGTGNFTVEFWIYSTSWGGAGGNYTTVFDTRPNSTNGQYWIFSFYGSGTAGSPTFVSSPGGSGLILTSNVASPLNQWVHFALVNNGGTFTMYQNGISIASASYATALGASQLIVGQDAFGNSGCYVNGYLSNVRIVKGTALYTSNFTPSTIPLIPVTNTQLLLGTVSPNQYLDSSTNAYIPTVTSTPSWNQASPFATGLGYKNRVYTWTGNGTVTF